MERASTSHETADTYSEREFGGATFAAFDPSAQQHRSAAVALRDRLVEIGFGPERAAALFGLNDLAEVRQSRAAYYDALVLPRDGAGQAARFFVLHDAQEDGEVRSWLGDAGVEFLIAMRAIVPVDGRRRSIVSASWFAGSLIFADARAYNLIWPSKPFTDYVMPPGGDSVGLFHVAPRAHRRAALDLCCGPGTQTLAAAAYSDRAVGVDVNPRALRFARFNAAANRVEHATFVLGDLYAPLGNERFDAILANPPFVPWPQANTALLYRGGGARGEDVLERIVAGAIAHLEPAGSLTVVSDLADVETLPARLQRWQGASRRTLIVLQHSYDLLEYAETHAAHRDGSVRRQARVVQLLEHYRAAQIRSLDFGYVVQDGLPGAAQTVRTSAPHTTSIAGDVAAWFAHQRRLAAGNVADADAVLELAPGARLVDIAEREPDGSLTASCYLAPGAASVHEATAVSRSAFALLIRVAAGGLRPRDVTESDAVRELPTLLERGLVRFSASV